MLESRRIETDIHLYRRLLRRQKPPSVPPSWSDPQSVAPAIGSDTRVLTNRPSSVITPQLIRIDTYRIFDFADEDSIYHR